VSERRCVLFTECTHLGENVVFFHGSVPIELKGDRP
jgi:hypothetical protein